MFRSRFSLLFVCFAVLLATSLADEDDVDMAANTVTIRGNDTSVRIEGNTGTIRAVHHEKDDDDEDDDDDEGEMEDFSDDNEGVLTFQIDSLQEIDSAGNPVGLTGPSKKKHGVSSLVSQIEKYTFTQLDNSSTYQGIPVKNVNLSVHLTGPNASVDLQVMLFLRDGNVTFGNETFSVKSGTFKFNIKVSDWKFCGGNSDVCTKNNQNETGQYLDLALSIRSQAEEPEEIEESENESAEICVNDDPDEKDDCPKIFNMGGNSTMVLNRGVVTGNNDYVAFPTGYPKFENIGGLVKKFTFRIPRFNDTVLIDPSVNVGSYIPAVTNPTNKPGGGGHNAGQSLHFVSCLLLLSMFASLCCFY